MVNLNLTERKVYMIKIFKNKDFYSLVCKGLFILILSIFVLLSSMSISYSTYGKSNSLPIVPIASLGVDPSTQVSISWFTSIDTTDTYIKYSSVTSSTAVKQRADCHVDITDTDKRYAYRADLKGLTPDTSYNYNISNLSGTELASGSFRTSPGEASNVSWTFIQLTDTQGATLSDYSVAGKTLGAALVKYPDARFIIHTGDVVDKGAKITQWDWFSEGAKPFISSLPVEAAVGNHDVLNGNGTNKNIKNFTDRFALPKLNGTGAINGTAYSFDYGEAHFAVLNTETDAKGLKAEAQWLKKDMLSSNKHWKIAALHRGPYGATHDSKDVRSILVPAFDASGVNLVLQGHDHNYIRTYPMKNQKRTDLSKGTLYITSGRAGVKTYPIYPRSWQALDLSPQSPMYTAITVTNDTISINAYDVTGKLIDNTTIKH